MYLLTSMAGLCYGLNCTPTPATIPSLNPDLSTLDYNRVWRQGL